MSAPDTAGASLDAARDTPITHAHRLRETLARLLSRETAAQPAVVLPLWVHACVLLAVAVLSLYIARAMWDWTYDDVFIIYRYARNFADGLGMVYNPGEPFFGTTSPGYTLLLAALYKLAPGVDMLTLGSIVSTISLAACGALVWFIGVQTRSPLAGLLGALITLTNPLMVVHWGGEMPLLVALVLGAVLAYSRGLGTLTGALLGLAVLTRQDSLVLVAAIGAHYFLTKRKVPVGAVIAFLAVMLPWVAYSWIFFGSPLPSTLEAKVNQGKAGWAYFLSGSITWLSQILGPGLPRFVTLLLIPLGAATLLVETLKRKPLGPWWLVLAWCALYTVGYTALRVAFYGWYAIPLALGLCLLMAWGVVGVTQTAGAAVKRLASALSSKRASPGGDGTAGSGVRLRAAVWAVMLAALLLVCWQPVKRLRDFDDNYLSYHRLSDVYERVGHWLAEHGGPSVSVAYLEIGEVGYYSNSQLIDLMGLVTPGAANRVLSMDYDWAIQHYRPTYYLASSRFNDLLGNPQEEYWFTTAYEKVTTFQDPWQRTASTYQMDVYKLKSGASLPDPLRPIASQHMIQQAYWPLAGATANQIEGQTFTVSEDNLSAIALRLSTPYPGAAGTLVLHLRHNPSGGQDIRQVSVPLSEIGANSWLTVRFDPLPDSKGQSYYFSVELRDTTPGEKPPLALFYATDDLYRGGTRYEGSKPVQGDLCFRAYVPDGQ